MSRVQVASIEEMRHEVARARKVEAIVEASRAGKVIPFPASTAPPQRPEAPGTLTKRWYPLRHHPEQHRLMRSTARYRVVPAGRRSGKTEIAKRFGVGTGLCAHPEARFFLGAPTWQQAKRIWWADLKALSPKHLVSDYSDGELWIRYVNGAEIHVVGTDVAARLEGTPWDGGILDEYGNMRPEVWDAHLRPVMAERGGWCWFIGVPEGRNHYYDLFQRARAESLARQLIAQGKDRDAREALRAAYGDELPEVLEWDAFTWISADILPASEIAAAKRDMPQDLYEQEFEARFTAFRGRAYKAFREETHCAPLGHLYDPRKPLIFCFDFNVEPGVAAVAQEMTLPNGQRGAGFLGEVWIPYDSDTVMVCRKLVSEWEGHQGPVYLYGDETGGRRKSSASREAPTDWKLVDRELRGHFRIENRVPSSNPPERDRVNAVNAMLEAADGTVRLMVDPIRAPHLVRDFEGVRLVEGGSGEIAKSGTQNKNLTHLSDAAGYWIHERWPIPDQSAQRIKGYAVA